MRPRQPNALSPGTPDVSWPQAGQVDLTATAQPQTVDIGGLPVSVASGGIADQLVTVEVADRTRATSAGIAGVVMRLVGAGGPVRLSVNYHAFAAGYGGDYGARLRIYRLPDCRELAPACTTGARPLDSANDSEIDVLSATVQPTPSGLLLAVMADDDSPQGDYRASALSPSSEWSAGGSSGAFTWSYPVATPPVPGGLAPTVGLSYTSQAVDGRTAMTNNQGSWIGEGFSYEPGYIERRYKPCEDDGHSGKFDLCWAWDNATIMLNGTSGELVKDGSTWRIESDDDSKVDRLTGASNGDNNGEHWRVTTTDGTQYFFGRHRLPGWATGNPVTNSTWTVPAFGDDSGEPCHGTTFATSDCAQGWRWNLDYVVDPRGNATSYFYTKETNYYARNGDTSVDGTAYTRGGYLTQIEYGQRASTIYTTPAPARVSFGVAERCLPNGTVTCTPGELNDDTAAHWPDVPWDRHCAAGTHCGATQTAPSFWTRKRLTTITTEIRTGGGYDPVSGWKLGHSFVSNADLSRSLWPESITRTGKAGPGADVTLPSTTLLPVQRPNRVDEIGDHISPLIRPRLATVYTDSGGQIDVTYSGEDCTPGSTPSPASNTRRCFPVRWQPGSASDLITDWFHKYVVEEVVVSDRVGESPDQVTRYEYLGGAAWRHTDPDGIVDEDRLTWGQWRGYRNVRVIGAPNTTLATRVDYTYLRGMHGDDNGSGGTRDVTVPDSTGATHRDHDQLAGRQLEQIVYNGSQVVAKTVTTSWRQITATDTHSWGDQQAAFVRPDITTELVALVSGGWRTTEVDNDYDPAHGRLTLTDDHGDMSTTADDQCTRVQYADNLTGHLLEFPSRQETVAVRCAAAPNRATDVLTDTRTFYDGGGFGQAPSRGLVTRNDELATHTGTTPTYVMVTEASHDSYGRPVEHVDAGGNSTTTSYADTAGLNTGQTVTNPLGHATTTLVDPAHGQPVETLDANDLRTSMAYDGLVRLTGVWLPNRTKTLGSSPNLRFSYHVTGDAPVAVVTETLNADAVTYRAERELFDGWLRPRQTQVPGPGGGRLVTDTGYDALGRVHRTNDLYHADGAPSNTLLVADDGEVNGQTVTVYDRAGRKVEEIFQAAGQERWRTATGYGGDRVHTTPPPGGTAATAISDARGNVVELRQYHGGVPSGGYDATTYHYTPRDELAQVMDPAGNAWSYTYDQRGRRIESADPDAGTTTFAYDNLDQLTSTTDSRGVTLSHTYDPLGRKTATYQGQPVTGTKLSQWFWDNFELGQLAGSRSFDGDLTITMTVPFRDYLYRPNRTTYHIAGDSAGQLAGSYDFSTQHNIDHTIQSATFPASGGLPAAGVNYTYDQLRRNTSVSGDVAYASQIDYYPTGELAQLGLFAGATDAWHSFEYEQGTNRLQRAFTTIEGVTGTVADATYTYDPAGNLTSIVDDPGTGGGQRDAQCFDHDHLRRLTTAWTTAGAGDGPTACADEPTATGLAGPAPYWHDYSFDPVGNRIQLVEHATGTSESDVTTTNTHPPAGTAQPHTLLESTTTSGAQHTYSYDPAGNTTSIDRDGTLQTLTWDPQGSLKTATQDGDTTEFVYDAEGNRILRNDTDGSTLFLPGLELRQPADSSTVTATRYIDLPGGVTYLESAGSPAEYQISDHHGTSTRSIDPGTGAVTHRRMDPYGNPRGPQPPDWSGQRGFVGGTQDPTGFTHLGAREYNPTTGRFISLDPLMDLTDPQQMHGYIYANNSPPSFTDQTGLSWGDFGKGLLSGWQQVQQAPVQFAVQTYHFAEANVTAAASGEQSWGDAYQNWQAYQGAATLESVACVVTCIVSAVENTDAAIDAAHEGDWQTAGERGYLGAADAGNFAMFFAGGSGVLTRIGGATRFGRPFIFGTCRNSFLPGTTVAMADGTDTPIEDIVVGDDVIATDPETGKTTTEPVIATITGDGEKTLVEIALGPDSDAANSSDTITATENHPIWVTNRDDNGAWVDAADLKPGDLLLAPDRTTTGIEAVKIYQALATVHNLTVANVHTYYVTTGDAAILTHNIGLLCPQHDPIMRIDDLEGNPLLPCNGASPACPTRNRPEVGDQVTEPHPSAEVGRPGVPNALGAAKGLAEGGAAHVGGLVLAVAVIAKFVEWYRKLVGGRSGGGGAGRGTNLPF